MRKNWGEFFLPACVFYVISELSMKNFLSMLFSKLLKAGAAASLVLTCAGVNAQSWTSNSTYGLYVNQLKGIKGNVAIGVAASASYQGNKLTIKADSAKNGLRIYDYSGTTRLLQGSNGGLTVGAASTAPANGLYVAGASNLRGNVTIGGNLSVAGTSTFSKAATFNNTLKVTGATTLAGTTTGSLTASTLVSNGSAVMKGSLTVSGRTNMPGGLNVTGTTSLATTTISALTVNSFKAQNASTFNGTAAFKKIVTFDTTATFKGKASFDKNIVVYGGGTFYNGLEIKTGSSMYNNVRFYASNGWAHISACGYNNYDPMAFLAQKYNFKNGNVGIGVENPQAKLHVAGKILCTGEIEVADLNSNSIKVNSLNAKDIQMDMHGAADYVFEDNYDLKSLSEVESYVNEHKHLPGMPSAAEMDANGVSVSKMSNLLLEKVEELTLHMIKLEKENAALKARVQELEK